MTMKYLVRFNKLDVPNHKSIMAIKLLKEATGCKLLSAKKIITGHHGEPPSLAIMSEDQYQTTKLLDQSTETTLSLLEECGYQMVLLDKKDLP